MTDKTPAASSKPSAAVAPEPGRAGDKFRQATMSQAARDPQLRSAAATLRVAHAYIERSAAPPAVRERVAERFKETVALRLDRGEAIPQPKLAPTRQRPEPEIERDR